MAEGLARRVFDASVRIDSAGSTPTHVNPLAIEVMAEIGIDITNQTSKSVETINPAGVDLVITLCAEEVCPVVLQKISHLHWPLLDPTAHGVGDEGRTAFRKTRDEIVKRLDQLRLGSIGQISFLASPTDGMPVE